MYITKEKLIGFIMNIENKLYEEMLLNLTIEYYKTHDESPNVSTQDICKFISEMQQSDLNIYFNQ